MARSLRAHCFLAIPQNHFARGCPPHCRSPAAEHVAVHGAAKLQAHSSAPQAGPAEFQTKAGNENNLILTG